jgi:hypothetical protein
VLGADTDVPAVGALLAGADGGRGRDRAGSEAHGSPLNIRKFAAERAFTSSVGQVAEMRTFEMRTAPGAWTDRPISAGRS